MKRQAKIGSVSHGTMRPEDLIPTFIDQLRALRGSVPKALYNSARAFAANKPEDGEDSELVANLSDALNALAPPYCYFGSHPGDGADYGFWLSEDWESMFGDWQGEGHSLRVADTSEVPKDFSGEVLLVNDHGNVTLYVAREGKLTEVWAVV